MEKDSEGQERNTIKAEKNIFETNMSISLLFIFQVEYIMNLAYCLYKSIFLFIVLFFYEFGIYSDFCLV